MHEEQIQPTPNDLSVVKHFCSELSLDSETREHACALFEQIVGQFKLEGALINEQATLCEMAAASAVYIASQTANTEAVDGRHLRGNRVCLAQVIQALGGALDASAFLLFLEQFLARKSTSNGSESLNKRMRETVKRYKESAQIFQKFEANVSALGLSVAPSSAQGSCPDEPPTPSIAPALRRTFIHTLWILFLNLKSEVMYRSQDDKLQRDMAMLIAIVSQGVLNFSDGWTFTALEQRLSQELGKTIDLSTISKRETVARQIKELIRTALTKNSLESTLLEYYEGKTLQEMRKLREHLARRKSIDLGAEQEGTSKTGFQGIFEARGLESVFQVFKKHYRRRLDGENCAVQEPDTDNGGAGGEDSNQMEEIAPVDESCFLRARRVFTPHKDQSGLFSDPGDQNQQRTTLSSIETSHTTLSSSEPRAADGDSDGKKRGFASHRVLNYEQQLSAGAQNPLKQDLLGVRQSHPNFMSPMPSISLQQQQHLQQQQQLLGGLVAGNFFKIKNSTPGGTSFVRKYSSSMVGGAQAPSPIVPSLERHKWLNYYSNSAESPKVDHYLQLLGDNKKNDLLQEVQQIVINLKIRSQDHKQEWNNKVANFFLNVLEKMISNEEKLVDNYREKILRLVDNREFLFSLLAVCLDTFCYVQGHQIQLSQILRATKVTPQDCWRVVSAFARFDKSMHQTVMEHIFKMERVLLINLIWADGEQTASLMQNFFQPGGAAAAASVQGSEKQVRHDEGQSQNATENATHSTKIQEAQSDAAVAQQQASVTQQQVSTVVTPPPPFHLILCKRILTHTALRIYEICKLLSFSDVNAEKVWQLIKHIFEREQELLYNRFLDQLIICSLYAIFMTNKKDFDQEIRFKGILEAYSHLEFFQKEQMQMVRLDCTGLQVDIITFYNKHYLPPIRRYFSENKATPPTRTPPAANNSNSTATATENVTESLSSTVTTPKNQTQVNRFKPLASPLTQSIPKSFFLYSPVCKEQLQQQKQAEQYQRLSPRPKISTINGLLAPPGKSHFGTGVQTVVNKSQLTPLTKGLYAFGETIESPAVKLQQPQVTSFVNQQQQTAPPGNQSSQQHLNLNENTLGAGGIISGSGNCSQSSQHVNRSKRVLDFDAQEEEQPKTPIVQTSRPNHLIAQRILQMSQESQRQSENSQNSPHFGRKSILEQPSKEDSQK